jgi:hypothetical protein
MSWEEIQNLTDVDIKKMSNTQIQNVCDQALDHGAKETFQRFSQYIKESKRIHIRKVGL